MNKRKSERPLLSGWVLVMPDKPNDLSWDMGNGAIEVFTTEEYARCGKRYSDSIIRKVVLMDAEPKP